MPRDPDTTANSEATPPLGTLLRVHEAADLLHCSIATVRRLIAQKKLPAYRVGGGIRIAEADLERVLRPLR